MSPEDVGVAEEHAPALTGDPPSEPAGLRVRPSTPYGSAPFTTDRRSSGTSSKRRGTRRKRRGPVRLAGRILAICGLIGVVIAVVLAGAAFWLMHGYDKNIERFGDPFTALPDDTRPQVVAADAQNILLLGSDSRITGASDPDNWTRGAQRTDAIMIMHIPADRKSVTITSIPRDSWVTIPGHGKNKINAGFSFGGPTLQIKTVEDYTGIRIDHVMIVDFEGFKNITDELGGVRITVPKATHDSAANYDFAAGTQVMDGETALRYVRERHGLPGGDFDRVKRQQNWIRALMVKATSQNILTHPLALNSQISSLTMSLAVDDEFSFGDMRSLALSLRGVRPASVHFMTAPVEGTGREGKQDVVYLDWTSNQELWTAVADDKLDDWLASHPGSTLGASVR